MSGRRGAPADGVQLELSLDRAESDRRITGWVEEIELRREVAAFTGRLPANALLASHLQAMVNESPYGTAAALLGDAERAVAAIGRPARRATRQARHLAVQQYIALCPDLLLDGTAAKLQRRIEAEFPGRATPLPQLVDRELGGSRRAVRSRARFTLDDGEGLIEATASVAGSEAGLRDRALAAVHVRSGVPPFAIEWLDWDVLMEILPAAGEVARVALTTKRGAKEIAFHISAIRPLAALRRAEGQPRSGPVFRGVRAPRERLTGRHISRIVRRVVSAAGLAALDRRHLRAPFGWWLQQHLGWSDLVLRDALGFRRTRDLIELLRPLREEAAQLQASEFVVLPSSDSLIEEPASADATTPRPAVTFTSGVDALN